jgi:hypothetical protein
MLITFFRTLVGGQVWIGVQQDYDRPACHEEGQGHLEVAQRKATKVQQRLGEI